MPKILKANIYDVQESIKTGKDPVIVDTPDLFADAINSVHELPDAARCVTINARGRYFYQLYNFKKLFFLNFITFRYSGPGIGDVTNPADVKRISVTRDERFAYETAMLYDSNYGLAFVESGQTGMAAGGIAYYFRTLTKPKRNFQLIPRLDPEAAARAQEMKAIQCIEARVVMGPATSKEKTLNPFEMLGERYGAKTIDITIAAAPLKDGKPLDRNQTNDLIAAGLKASEQNDVTRLVVRGLSREDSSLEVIDLLQHKERRERDLEVDPQTRKIPHEHRWGALQSIRDEFVRDAELA